MHLSLAGAMAGDRLSCLVAILDVKTLGESLVVRTLYLGDRALLLNPGILFDGELESDVPDLGGELAAGREDNPVGGQQLPVLRGRGHIGEALTVLQLAGYSSPVQSSLVQSGPLMDTMDPFTAMPSDY
jgi:hypothetical protein